MAVHAAGSRSAEREGTPMSWTAPEMKEISRGMEIDMYAPADDQDGLF
jgi:coenzyme PQQ precursor peptide PqqA